MTPRKRAVRFRVEIDLDRAPGGTVTITPDGMFVVRPLRRRVSYALPLAAVARLVVLRLILAEANAKRAARRAVRRRRG